MIGARGRWGPLLRPPPQAPATRRGFQAMSATNVETGAYESTERTDVLAEGEGLAGELGVQMLCHECGTISFRHHLFWDCAWRCVGCGHLYDPISSHPM